MLQLCNPESPFEFRALEVALEAICSFLDARTTELETAAYPALDELTSKVCHNLFRELLSCCFYMVLLEEFMACHLIPYMYDQKDARFAYRYLLIHFIYLLFT